MFSERLQFECEDNNADHRLLEMITYYKRFMRPQMFIEWPAKALPFWFFGNFLMYLSQFYRKYALLLFTTSNYQEFLRFWGKKISETIDFQPLYHIIITLFLPFDGVPEIVQFHGGYLDLQNYFSKHRYYLHEQLFHTNPLDLEIAPLGLQKCAFICTSFENIPENLQQCQGTKKPKRDYFLRYLSSSEKRINRHALAYCVQNFNIQMPFITLEDIQQRAPTRVRESSRQSSSSSVFYNLPLQEIDEMSFNEVHHLEN